MMEGSSEAGEETAYYCYCLAMAGSSLVLSGLGCIVDGLPPYPLWMGELQAVVSVVPMAQYSEGRLKSNFQRADWVETAVLSHERVVEGCLQQTDVVPMKFCTIFRSEKDVVDAMSHRQEELTSKLLDLKGRREWGLRVVADRDRLRRSLMNSDPHLPTLRSSVESKPAGAAYFARKRLEDRLACSMERTMVETSQSAYARLSAAVPRAKLLKGNERASFGDSLVLNAAFLATETELAALLAAVEQMVSESPWLRCEPSGPWPPYNFV